MSPKRSLLAIITPVLLCLVACSAPGRLYPVQGPLAAATPAPVLAAKLTVHPPRSATFTVVLADGSKATGPLAIYTAGAKGQASPPTPMSQQWDAIYGQGSYVATVLGQGQDGQGVLTSSSGVTFRIEIHYAGAASVTQGVAQDNQGNLYKVAF